MSSTLPTEPLWFKDASLNASTIASVSFDLHHKVREFMSAIQQHLMRRFRRIRMMSPAESSAHAALNRAVALLVRLSILRSHHVPPTTNVAVPIAPRTRPLASRAIPASHPLPGEQTGTDRSGKSPAAQPQMMRVFPPPPAELLLASASTTTRSTGSKPLGTVSCAVTAAGKPKQRPIHNRLIRLVPPSIHIARPVRLRQSLVPHPQSCEFLSRRDLSGEKGQVILFLSFRQYPGDSAA